MRILLVNRAMPAHVAGGLERHAEDLLLGVAAAREFEIHLLCARLPEAERERYAALGVRVHEAPGGDPRSYGLRYLLGIGRKIAELQRHLRFGLIHAQEFALGAWNPPLGAPPILLSVHGTITSETPLHPDCWRTLKLSEKGWAVGRFARRRLYTPFWKRHLRAASRILVDSDFSRRELDRIVPDCHGNIFRVPLAVREEALEVAGYGEAREALGWSGIHLLTVGRIEWQKGQTLALEALAELRGSDWHYTIAGEGSESAALRRLVGKLRLESRVTLAGRVDEATKSRMLSAADLFVWPERTHPAFGLAGLEAMLHSTPSLGTPRGALPEVIRDKGGWLAADATAEALKQAIAPLLTKPALLQAKREGLADWARRQFSYDLFIQTMLHQYRAVMGLRG